MFSTYALTPGTIGDAAIEAVAARPGITVRVLTRHPQDATYASPDIESVEADLSDLPALTHALRGAEAYLSVTPLVEPLAQWGRNAVEAAQAAGVSRLVRASALGAASSQIPMQQLHREVEEAVEQSGVAYTVVRPASLMQNVLGWARTIRAEGVFYAALGDAPVSWVDARDVGAVAAAALVDDSHSSQAYDLTGGEALTAADLAQTLSDVLGRKIRYVEIPDDGVRAAMRSAPTWTVDRLEELNRYLRSGQAAILTPDVERVLGRPPTRFDQFVQDHRAAFQPDA